MITFVTAFLPGDNPKRSADAYKAFFQPLALRGLPIVLFLDKTIDWEFPPNVKVYRIDGCRNTWIGHTIPDDAVLPSVRSSNDTLLYLKIQNSKLHRMLDAARINPFQTEWFAWIDFGITHVFRTPSQTLDRLEELRPPPTPCLRTAGIWTHSVPDIWDRICWRFAGGFLLAHRSKLPDLCSKFETVIVQHLPCFTWEVNYWALMESEGIDFGWFAADHNDSIIPNNRT
jgi:hypothetical protein